MARAIVQTILLEEPISFTADQLKNLLQLMLGEMPIEIEAVAKQAFRVVLAFAEFTVMLIDRPMPAASFEHALKQKHHFDNAEQVIVAHQAHIVLSPITQPNNHAHAINICGGLMYLGNAVAVLGKPLAFFWNRSQMLASLQEYAFHVGCLIDAITLSAQQDPNAGMLFPNGYWIGMHFYSDPIYSDLVGLRSEGLDVFFDFEIDITPLAWPADSIALRLIGTVAYLLSRGMVFNDGETLGISETEHFRIHYWPASANKSGTLQLTLESSSGIEGQR